MTRSFLVKSLLLTSIIALGGCQTSSDPSAPLQPDAKIQPNTLEKQNEHPVIDNTPPLSSDELESVAANCRAEISQLHELRNQVPRPRLQEYAVTLGIASDACTKMSGLLSQIREATHWKRAYQLNLQHAQSTAEGGFGADMTSPTHSTTPSSGVIVESEPLTIN